MIGGPHVSSSSGGTPPASGGAGSAVVCADCGNCSFSAQSYFLVQKFIPSCDLDGNVVLTQQDSTWPWLSATASITRWQFDANNWIEYSCVNNMWSFSATNVDWVSQAPCLGNNTPAYFFYNANPCTGFEWRKKKSDDGDYYVFLRAILVNNVCTPSVPFL